MVYLVVRHVWTDGYGDYLDVVGIYNDEAQAESIVNGFKDDTCDIHEVILGATYPAPLEPNNIFDRDKTILSKVIRLGGYAE